MAQVTGAEGVINFNHHPQRGTRPAWPTRLHGAGRSRHNDFTLHPGHDWAHRELDGLKLESIKARTLVVYVTEETRR